jgi:hypothetical protein
MPLGVKCGDVMAQFARMRRSGWVHHGDIVTTALTDAP